MANSIHCRLTFRRAVVVLLLLALAMPAALFAQAPPLPINYGQTVEGELNDVQQAIQYIFDAEAGDEITLLMQTIGGNLNTALSLATFAGDVVASDDDSGGGTDALIEVTIQESGSYVVTAARSRTGVGGAGNFTLSLSLGQLPIPDAPEGEVGPRLQPILRGTPLQGALTPETRFTLFWFEGRADEAIIVTSDPGTNLQPQLVLYNARFTEIVRGASGSPLTASLPVDDLYFIAAAAPDALSPGGNYAITLSSGTGSSGAVASPPRDVQPGQNSITYGERVRGTVSDTASAFTFQFSGSAGDTITINMTRAGGDLDSYLFLLDSGGVTLAEDDNSGGGNGDALLTTSLPADGDYLILATRLDQDSGTTSGNFLLSLASDSQPVVAAEPPPSSGSGAPTGLPELLIGSSVNGTLSDSVFFNPYMLRAVEGDEIVITMEAEDALDPLLLLLDETQQPLADNDDATDGNQDSRIEFTIPQTGSYVIVATRFEQELGTTTGGYTLTVSRAGEEVSSDDDNGDGSLIQRLGPERISPGGTPAGAFDPLRFANTYAFGVTDAALIDFSVSTDNNIASTIILVDEQLQPIAATDGGTLLGVELPSSGNYLFIVAPAGGPAAAASENYILAFNATGADVILAEEPSEEDEPDETETPEAVEAPPVIPISYSETVTGIIDDDVPEREYIFTGLADDVIRISMTGIDGSLDTLVQLLDENGEVIGENDDIVPGDNRDSLLQIALPENGEYTIRATRFDAGDGTPASVGNFELTLAFVDPDTIGISPIIEPIESGQTVSNAVSDEQYLMFYSFNANSGDVVDIEVNTLSGDLDAVLYVYAYTSSGEPVELRRNDDSPRGGTFDPLIENLVLPRTGTYLIAVGRFPESISTGEFSLLLQVTPGDAVPPAEPETPTPAAEG